MYQDAHIHLLDCQDSLLRESFLKSAGTHGMERIFCNSSSPTDWNAVASIAKANQAIIPFFGVHPWFAVRLPAGWDERLKKFLQLPNAGLGEIGLDKAREEVPWRMQKDVFERQLSLAVEFKKPFIVHCVRAWGELTAVLKTFDMKAPFIVHAFYGPVEMIPLLLDLGGYLSFSSRQLDHCAPKTKKALLTAPLDRILLETDYPGRNELFSNVDGYKVLLQRLYKNAAAIKNCSQEILEEKVWENGAVFTR